MKKLTIVELGRMHRKLDDYLQALTDQVSQLQRGINQLTGRISVLENAKLRELNEVKEPAFPELSPGQVWGIKRGAALVKVRVIHDTATFRPYALLNESYSTMYKWFSTEDNIIADLRKVDAVLVENPRAI